MEIQRPHKVSAHDLLWVAVKGLQRPGVVPAAASLCQACQSASLAWLQQPHLTTSSLLVTSDHSQNSACGWLLTQVCCQAAYLSGICVHRVECCCSARRSTRSAAAAHLLGQGKPGLVDDKRLAPALRQGLAAALRELPLDLAPCWPHRRPQGLLHQLAAARLRTGKLRRQLAGVQLSVCAESLPAGPQAMQRRLCRSF